MRIEITIYWYHFRCMGASSKQTGKIDKTPTKSQVYSSSNSNNSTHVFGSIAKARLLERTYFSKHWWTSQKKRIPNCIPRWIAWKHQLGTMWTVQQRGEAKAKWSFSFVNCDCNEWSISILGGSLFVSHVCLCNTDLFVYWQYMRDFRTRNAHGVKEHFTGRYCSIPGFVL